jgi:hypothetical protein
MLGPGIVLVQTHLAFKRHPENDRLIIAPGLCYGIAVLGFAGLMVWANVHEEGYDDDLALISPLIAWATVGNFMYLAAQGAAVWPMELLWRKHRPRWFDRSPMVAAVAWVLTILAVNAVELSLVALILDPSANLVNIMIFWSLALAISLIVYRLILPRLPTMTEEHVGISVS